jgi:hypothetical protein
MDEHGETTEEYHGHPLDHPIVVVVLCASGLSSAAGF